MRKLKKIPKFNTEDEERDFWDKINFFDYFDASRAQMVDFTNLTPSTETISLRLPEWMLRKIKIEANKRDVPYQSYIKMILSEKLEKLNLSKLSRS